MKNTICKCDDYRQVLPMPRAFGWLMAAGAVAWVVLVLVYGLGGCAALKNVTPADRASAYAREAQGVAALCKAYRFDRSVGLVADVPAMTELCK